MTERGKGKNEAEGGKKEGPASVPLQRATHASPPPTPRGLQLPAGPGRLGLTGGAGPAPASPVPVAPHVTAAAAAPAGTCSMGRRWGWGWARRRAGAGRAGAGPSPVTSCGAAGAGAALQRLRRWRPRLALLPASLRPPRPGGARLLCGHSASPNPTSLPSAPSSFPSSPPPRTAGRGTSPGQQPGETAGPDGAAGAGGPRAWGLGRGGPARSRPCSAPPLHPPPGPLSPARGAFPEEAGSSAPPSPRAPRAAWTPGRPQPLRPALDGPENRCHAALLHSFSSRGVAEVILGAGAGGVRGGSPRFQSLGVRDTQITSAGYGA